MRTTQRTLLLFVILISLSAGLRAQDAQTPSFRAGIEALPVDVTVVDTRGQPIRDLLPADFTVRIDGRPRRVVNAQWIAASAAGKAAAAPVVPEGYTSNESAAGGRLIVMVIDQPNIPFGDLRPIHDAVNGFIDRLSPSDRVSIIGLGQPSVTTPFLADKEQLKQTVSKIPGQRQQFGGGASHEMGVAAAMAIERGDDAALNQVQSRDCVGPPRQRAPCVEEIRAEATNIAQVTRQASASTLANLRELLNSLRAIDGPKILMYVSQGFFTDRERGDDTSSINELGALAAAGRTSIYSLRLEDTAEISRSKAQFQQFSVEDELIRRYGLETLTAAGGGALFNLAGTGGAAFERVSAELSGYYLLGVESEARDRDGKPHPIRVDVGRPNVTIRAHRTMLAGGDPSGAAAGAPRSPRRSALRCRHRACRFARSRSRFEASSRQRFACSSTPRSGRDTRRRSAFPWRTTSSTRTENPSTAN